MGSIVGVFILLILKLESADFQSLSTLETQTGCTRIANGEQLTLRCTTLNNYDKNINFQKNDINQGVCVGGTTSCFSTPYSPPTRTGTQYTDLQISQYNDTTDSGNWTCLYDGTPSDKIEITLTECSPLSSDSKGLTAPPVIGSVIGFIIIVMIVLYCCSNKNCKTHEVCWCCKEKFYSDFPTAPTNMTRVEWTIDHYKSSKLSCRRKVCNNWCCVCLLCCGLYLKNLPAVREMTGLIQTQKDSKSGSEPPVDRSKSLDSKSKDSKVYPAIDEHGNNIKTLDPIKNLSGTFETTDMIQIRSSPLPPIGKLTS